MTRRNGILVTSRLSWVVFALAAVGAGCDGRASGPGRSAVQEHLPHADAGVPNSKNYFTWPAGRRTGRVLPDAGGHAVVSSNEPCLEPRVLLQGYCVYPCRKTADCPQKMICICEGEDCSSIPELQGSAMKNFCFAGIDPAKAIPSLAP